jgi:hypothetical protein
VVKGFRGWAKTIDEPIKRIEARRVIGLEKIIF